MIYRSLGQGLPDISLLSMGSWNTFSRLDTSALSRLMARAFDQGVNFLDIAYYWDKPDTEDAVAAAFKALNYPRDRYVIAQKLWLWDYPKESFADQLHKSLKRQQLDHVDLVMVSRPTPDLVFETFVEEVVDLLRQGMSQGWGVTNWSPDQIRDAQQLCRLNGWPRPVLLQMQYNVMRRHLAENADHTALFQDGDIGLCAAFMLEGGILGGYLARDRVDPPDFVQGVKPVERNIARDSGGVREEIRQRQPQLAAIAADFGATAAQLSITFCVSNPFIRSGLFGVTSLTDLDDNLRAIDLLSRAAEIRTAVAALAIDGVKPPKLFNPHNDI